MIARHDGRIVFVSGAVPGERVRARVERVTKQAIWAEAVEIAEASPDRRQTSVDPACGGLTYAHIAYARQLAIKADIIEDAFRRLGRITIGRVVTVMASPEAGYRLRARLHVHEGRAGFFREGSHTWCDGAATAQLLPETLPAVDAQIAALGKIAGELEAVTVAENVAASERVLHLEVKQGSNVTVRDGQIALVPGVTGVTADGGGHRPLPLAGSATVTDAARDLFAGDSPVSLLAAWTRHAPAFFQGNRYLTGALVRRVLEWVSADAVIDLYAGVGLFSVALAARGARVMAIEGDRLAAADLSSNAKAWRARLNAICAPVESAASSARRAGTTFGACIVDPPRSGLSPEALAQVLSLRTPELIYVSCDPATLARDAAKLIADGYAIDGIEALDLFPNTPHVETVVRFVRGVRS